MMERGEGRTPMCVFVCVQSMGILACMSARTLSGLCVRACFACGRVCAYACFSVS